MLRPGDAAPDFVLKDADAKDVRLSRFSGQPIVLFFYPRDHTPGCTMEMKGFRDHDADMQRLGAVVVGVSLDDADSHCRIRDQLGLRFHLLADPDGRAHDLYDAWRTTLLGRTAFAVRRCTYIIDPDGIIRQVYGRVNVWSHAKQVVKDLERLQAQRSWGAERPPRQTS